MQGNAHESVSSFPFGFCSVSPLLLFVPISSSVPSVSLPPSRLSPSLVSQRDEARRQLLLVRASY
jgi:hypothetical protein